MNTPGQGADNWGFRARRWEFNGERAGWLRSLATLTGWDVNAIRKKMGGLPQISEGAPPSFWGRLFGR